MSTKLCLYIQCVHCTVCGMTSIEKVAKKSHSFGHYPKRRGGWGDVTIFVRVLWLSWFGSSIVWTVNMPCLMSSLPLLLSSLCEFFFVSVSEWPPLKADWRFSWWLRWCWDCVLFDALMPPLIFSAGLWAQRSCRQTRFLSWPFNCRRIRWHLAHWWL